jgi:hypothetical protein
MRSVTLEELLVQAGLIVPGAEINATLHGIREQMVGCVGYEMVLDDRTLEDLLHVELPKLTEHLFAKRVPMLGAPFVILTCWRGEQAHIFSGDAFFDALASGLAISHDELRSRISAWRGEAGLPPDPWMRPNERAPVKGLLAPPKN